jgi:hypothetical protein
MLFQPTSYTRNRAFIRIGLWMGAVKNFDFIKQDYSHPAPFALAHFGTQFQKQRLNIPPRDIATDGMRKNCQQSSLVSPFHEEMVPHFGTIYNFVCCGITVL